MQNSSFCKHTWARLGKARTLVLVCYVLRKAKSWTLRKKIEKKEEKREKNKTKEERKREEK